MILSFAHGVTWRASEPIAAMRTGLRFVGRLHVRPVAHAHRETHAELRVKLGELVQHIFLFSSHTSAHVKRDALLMPGGATLYDAPALLGFDMRGLPAQGPFSPLQTQVCSCAVRWADVMVTWPCTSTNALRNAAPLTANDVASFSMFLSS